MRMRVTDLKMYKMDRRVHHRMKLQLSCSLASSTDNPGPVMGVTENISRGGVLIHWTAEPDIMPLPNSGDTIAVAVKLPLGPRCLRCLGKVVRVSTTLDGPNSVAVEIRRMSFSGKTEMFAPEGVASYWVN